jgi:hypothetical protein
MSDNIISIHSRQDISLDVKTRLCRILSFYPEIADSPSWTNIIDDFLREGILMSGLIELERRVQRLEEDSADNSVIREICYDMIHDNMSETYSKIDQLNDKLSKFEHLTKYSPAIEEMASTINCSLINLTVAMEKLLQYFNTKKTLNIRNEINPPSAVDEVVKSISNISPIRLRT